LKWKLFRKTTVWWWQNSNCILGVRKLLEKIFIRKIVLWEIVFPLNNFSKIFQSFNLKANPSLIIRINNKYKTMRIRKKEKKFGHPLKKISGYTPAASPGWCETGVKLNFTKSGCTPAWCRYFLHHVPFGWHPNKFYHTHQFSIEYIFQFTPIIDWHIYIKSKI